MKRPARSSAGFTLAELLVVIGIIGLVLAGTLSAKPKAVATRVAVTARSVTATLQLARAQAMSSNAETLFRIDVEKGRFGLPNSMHALPRGMIAAVVVCRDGALAAISAVSDSIRTASLPAARSRWRWMGGRRVSPSTG